MFSTGNNIHLYVHETLHVFSFALYQLYLFICSHIWICFAILSFCFYCRMCLSIFYLCCFIFYVLLLKHEQVSDFTALPSNSLLYLFIRFSFKPPISSYFKFILPPWCFLIANLWILHNGVFLVTVFIVSLIYCLIVYCYMCAFRGCCFGCTHKAIYVLLCLNKKVLYK